MLKKMQDVKIALVLAIAGLAAGFSLAPGIVESLSKLTGGQAAPPLPVLIVVSALQIGVMTFATGWIGIKLARRTQLRLPILDAWILGRGKASWEKQGLLWAIVLGVAAGFLIVGSDKFVFSNMIDVIRDNPQQSSLSGLILGVLYGGIVEEVLMRLFLMSLFVWLLAKLFARGRRSIPSAVYVVSILIAAALFAIAHFPATEAIFGELTPTIIVRSFILNGAAGIACGFLYWKKGLEYGIVSHMTAHISMQLLFIPLFY